MSETQTPPINGGQQLPPNFTIYRATCTDGEGKTVVIDVAGANYLGALAGLMSILCNNLVCMDKIVFQRMTAAPSIIPAQPRLFRG